MKCVGWASTSTVPGESQTLTTITGDYLSATLSLRGEYKGKNIATLTLKILHHCVCHRLMRALCVFIFLLFIYSA